MKNKDLTYYHNLINKYFLGEATAEEQTEIVNWIQESQDNKSSFESIKATWEMLNRDLLRKNINKEKDWQRIQEEIEERQQTEAEQDVPTPTISFLAKNFIKFAAAFLALMIPFYFLYKELAGPNIQEVLATKLIEQTLPDGTSVTLNKGAFIKFPEEFRGKERNIEVSGEIYLDVKHDSLMPFIVSTGDYTIKVLGTSFYVNSTPGNGKVKVVLDEGKVMLYNNLSPAVTTILNPNEIAVANKSGAKIIKSVNTDPNYMAFKTRKLSFDNTPFHQVLNDLQRTYHIRYKIDRTSPILNSNLTAEFEGATLDDIHRVIEASLCIEITENDKVYVITGEGC
jgi:ferric-dicitrate binding protein FerR (iron transport regulator)